MNQPDITLDDSENQSASSAVLEWKEDIRKAILILRLVHVRAYRIHQLLTILPNVHTLYLSKCYGLYDDGIFVEPEYVQDMKNKHVNMQALHIVDRVVPPFVAHDWFIDSVPNLKHLSLGKDTRWDGSTNIFSWIAKYRKLESLKCPIDATIKANEHACAFFTDKKIRQAQPNLATVQFLFRYSKSSPLFPLSDKTLVARFGLLTKVEAHAAMGRVGDLAHKQHGVHVRVLFTSNEDTFDGYAQSTLDDVEVHDALNMVNKVDLTE